MQKQGQTKVRDAMRKRMTTKTEKIALEPQTE
jgi:hypothetical protein